ncbi:hypothetical protein DFH09DRAFT_1453455 [Mycena vulgaris]|nr:hypothetical protein DFH09DRAFT_1453455 [Mycena vulgaris]
MFFASPFVSAALMMLASVTALPQPEDGGLVERVHLPASQVNTSLTAPTPPVAPMPGGKLLRRQHSEAMQYRLLPVLRSSNLLQPDATRLFTSAKGSSIPIPCPAGTYQPYPAQAFCYGAPKGRFQGLPGQATVCGTCCGWAAPLVNNNIAPVNCTGTTPYASPSSGDGCVSVKPSCVRAASCRQTYNTRPPTSSTAPPRLSGVNGGTSPS